MAKGKGEKRRGEKRHSITKIAGLGIGEYLTLTDGSGNFDTLMSNAQNPSELGRQQIIGLTGYDIQNHAFAASNLERFYGPVIGFWLLSYVGRKLVGPMKIGRKWKVF